MTLDKAIISVLKENLGDRKESLFMQPQSYFRQLRFDISRLGFDITTKELKTFIFDPDNHKLIFETVIDFYRTRNDYLDYLALCLSAIISKHSPELGVDISRLLYPEYSVGRSFDKPLKYDFSKDEVILQFLSKHENPINKYIYKTKDSDYLVVLNIIKGKLEYDSFTGQMVEKKET